MTQTWPQLFEAIRKHATKYFSSDEIKLTYKNPELDIDFDINDLEHAVNAHAKKKSANKYEIRIYAGLIAELDRYAQDAFDRYPFLFSIPDGHTVSRERAVSYMFFTWIDFIICHEWAHIISGHLEITNHAQWNEISDSPIIEQPDLRKALELEADSRATAFTLAGLADSWKDTTMNIYGNCDHNIAWRGFFHSMLMLFDFFEEKQKNIPIEKRTHPRAFYRAYTFQRFAINERDRIEGLPEIEGNDPNLFFAKIVIDFYQSITKRDPTEFLKSTDEAAAFCSNIDCILSSHGINNLRLTKNAART